jgi:hypothetical protein
MVTALTAIRTQSQQDHASPFDEPVGNERVRNHAESCGDPNPSSERDVLGHPFIEVDPVTFEHALRILELPPRYACSLTRNVGGVT